MRVHFPHVITGAFAVAALAASSGCGSSQPSAPDPSLTASPAEDHGLKVRDETPKVVQADVPELAPIHFELDEYQITRDARIVLEDVAVLMKENPHWTILLEGHCDERGSDEYNLALGESRAQSAKRYLVSLGVPADRFQTVSYGEARPVDPGKTEDSWARNRRAEFRVRATGR